MIVNASCHGLDNTVVTDAIAATVPDLSAAEFYVAGPPPMVNAVKAQLSRAEVPLTQVHYDSFG